MPNPVETVLLREREWLTRLRLVDRTELVWLIALPLAILLWAGLLLLYADWPTVLIATASHAVFGALALALSPRGRVHIWYGLIVLSMLHFMVFAALGYAHLPMLSAAYAVLACIALGLGAWRTVRLKQQWRDIAGYTQQDDFYWLVVQAPLVLRWRVSRILQHYVPTAREPL